MQKYLAKQASVYTGSSMGKEERQSRKESQRKTPVDSQQENRDLSSTLLRSCSQPQPKGLGLNLAVQEIDEQSPS